MTEKFTEKVLEYDEHNQRKKENKEIKPKRVATVRDGPTQKLTPLEKMQKESEELKAAFKEKKSIEETAKAAQKKKAEELKEWHNRKTFFVTPKTACGKCGAELDLQNAVLYGSQMMGTRKIGLCAHVGSVKCENKGCSVQNFVLMWTSDERGQLFIQDPWVVKGRKEFAIKPRQGIPTEQINAHFNKCLGELVPKHSGHLVRFK